MKPFEEAVALVTGAASGIGRAIAGRYAEVGARVVVSDVDDDGGRETVRMIEEGGGAATFVRADASDPEACEALVRRAVEAYGRLDIACNHADARGDAAQAAEHPLDAWQSLATVHLAGVFYGMKAQVPALLASGGGSIVNVASLLGGVGFKAAPAYIAAMHVLAGLTQDAAREYSSQGIRVNAVGPAVIRARPLSTFQDTAFNGASHPSDGPAAPSDVATLVAWLSSPESSPQNGAYYSVDADCLTQ